MPQDLLKRFKVLKKCRNKFDSLVYEMLFIRALKPNLQRAIRLHSCEGIFILVLLFIIFAPSHVSFRAKIALNAVICMIFFYIFLDSGVMTIPKRQFLSFVFTVLCF